MLVPQASAKEGGKGAKVFMWRAKSATATVYLLGTIHVGRADMYPLDRAITRAFKASKVLVVEADVSAARMSGLQAKVMALSTYPQGQTLQANVSAKIFGKLKAYCERAGYPVALFNRLRPFAIALTLTFVELMKHGYLPQYGLEMKLLEWAKANRKKVATIESVQMQLKLFADLSKATQEAFLSHTLDELPKTRQMYEKIVKAWLTGDAAAIEQLMLKFRTKDPKVGPIYRRIIDQRNVGMAAAVVKYLSGKRIVFVAVGAGHLVGQKGVVRMLIKKGFKVEQVGALGRPAKKRAAGR